MAEMKYLNTRIQLKYDSYENWKKVENQKDLLPGEIAIAYLGSTKTTTAPDNGTHPVLFKVGPGNFNALPWASALAADVYAWAKKENPDWADFDVENFPVSRIPAIPGIKLGLSVSDTGTGKFVTDVTYDETTKTFTITRDDAVNSLKAEDDDIVILTVDKEKGDVTATAAHKQYNKAGSTSDVSGDATTAGSSVTIKVPTLTVDAYGHTEFNGETSHTITIPSKVAVGDGNITIQAGTGLTGGDTFNVNQDTDQTITVNHQAKPTSGTAETATDGSGRTYVTEVLVDELGHIAGVKTATETVVDTNTAHTHNSGAGIAVSGNGGIDGEVTHNLNVAFELIEKTENDKTVKYISLYDKDDATKTPLATLDASEFIKDGMLDDVRYDAATNTLTFTWNTSAGKTQDTVTLTDILDPYVFTEGGRIDIEQDGVNVTISHEAIEPEGIEGSSSATYISTLTFDDYGHVTQYAYTDGSDVFKQLQEEKSGELTGAQVVASWAQDANGELTITTRDLTPSDIGAQPAGDYQPAGNYKTKQNAVSEDGSTTKTITKIEQNANGEVSVTYSDILYPTITIDPYDFLIQHNVPNREFPEEIVRFVDSTDIQVTSPDEQNEVAFVIKEKSITSDKIADHAVSAHHTKACQDYNGEDAEVWVFCCGSSTTLI